MANLYPAETGLPMTVWVSPRGRARHDVRVEVNRSHGPRMTITNTATVAIRPMPRLVPGRVSERADRHDRACPAIASAVAGEHAVKLELSDEVTFALRYLFTEAMEGDRYPLSTRIRMLRQILAKFGPMAPAPPPPARPPTPEDRDPRSRPRAGRPRR